MVSFFVHFWKSLHGFLLRCQGPVGWPMAYSRHGPRSPALSSILYRFMAGKAEKCTLFDRQLWSLRLSALVAGNYPPKADTNVNKMDTMPQRSTKIHKDPQSWKVTPIPWTWMDLGPVSPWTCEGPEEGLKAHQATYGRSWRDLNATREGRNNQGQVAREVPYGSYIKLFDASICIPRNSSHLS